MDTLKNLNNTKVLNTPKNFVNFSDINNLNEFYNYYDNYVFNNNSLISTSKVLKYNFNYFDYYDIFYNFYILGRQYIDDFKSKERNGKISKFDIHCDFDKYYTFRKYKDVIIKCYISRTSDIDADYIFANFNINMKILKTEL